MNAEYHDWRVWKEVELWEGKEYLQEYEEYSPRDVFNLCNSLIEKAEEKGLQGCFLRFQSHMEPCEDFLGFPSVVAVGYRKLNDEEKNQLEEEDFIEGLAKEKGITPYEAKHLKNLMDKGVV